MRSSPGPARFELIIFDCDGVLVDSETLSCACLMAQFAADGIVMDLDTVFEKFLGRSFAAVAAYYQARGRVMPADFAAQLRVRVRTAFAASLQTVAGVEEVLHNLTTQYCLASSSEPERVEFSLACTGLAAQFAGRVFTTSMVARGKPAPDLFLHAARVMHAAPARTLVVEDSISGVQAAKAAGMVAWGFVGASHYAASDGRAMLTAAGADRVFARMADFWQG